MGSLCIIMSEQPIRITSGQGVDRRTRFRGVDEQPVGDIQQVTEIMK